MIVPIAVLLRRPAIGWAVWGLVLATPLAAQVPTTRVPESAMGRSTPGQAAQLLQQPGVAVELQQRLGAWGMTPDQIRTCCRRLNTGHSTH